MPIAANRERFESTKSRLTGIAATKNLSEDSRICQFSESCLWIRCNTAADAFIGTPVNGLDKRIYTPRMHSTCQQTFYLDSS